MTATSPLLLAAVALGGALGSVARYLTGLWATAHLGLGFPWGTVIVNIVGCAVIGVLGGALAEGMQMPAAWRLFLITGTLGGFTTFSAFSLDTGMLWLRTPSVALFYVALSVLGGLAAFAATFAIARRAMGA